MNKKMPVAPANRQQTERLRKWMNAPANTHARESLLMHRLCFDVQLAAARAGYYVNTYYDDVDHDGFDIIFDDRDTIKKIQVKTVGLKNPARQWLVQKRMLRPALEMMEKLGFEGSPVGEGCGGGVILMRFDATAPDLAVEYLYTDVFILLAFESELIRRTHTASQKAVTKFLERWRKGIGSEYVTVPRAVFVKAKGPDELLELAGLHSCLNTAWLHHTFLVANNERQYATPRMELALPTLEKQRAFAAEGLFELLADRDLKPATS
jgi:hypothetical protein